MPIKKSSIITLLRLDRDVHSIKKRIELLITVVQRKMALPATSEGHEFLSGLFTRLQAVPPIEYFTQREDSPYQKKIKSIETIDFRYFNDSVAIILARLEDLRLDASYLFEFLGEDAKPETSKLNVSWSRWSKAIDRQIKMFESMYNYTRGFTKI